MTKKRFRMQFKFWLDDNRPEESELIDAIQDLKTKRSFSKAIRQGLRLWLSLMKGDVGVLVDLFPWVEDHFNRKQGDNGNHDDEDFAAAVANAVAAQLARGGYGGILQQAPLASRPADDDLVLHSVERDTSNINPGENFLKSVRAFLPGVLDPVKTTGGPVVMDVPQFTAPSFDDLDL